MLQTLRAPAINHYQSIHIQLLYCGWVVPTEPIKEPFPHTSCIYLQPQSLDSHIADSFPAVFGKLQRSWHAPARHERGITWSLTSAHRQRETPARRESLYTPGKETMCIGCSMFTLAHALRIALALGITQCVMLMFTHGDPRIRSGKTVSHTRISQAHLCWAHWKYGKTVWKWKCKIFPAMPLPGCSR